MIINRIAKIVSDWDMEMPAVILGSSITPISRVFSYTTILTLSPWLEFIGLPGFELAAFFSKSENVRRLIDKIEELKKAKRGEGW